MKSIKELLDVVDTASNGKFSKATTRVIKSPETLARVKFYGEKMAYEFVFNKSHDNIKLHMIGKRCVPDMTVTPFNEVVEDKDISKLLLKFVEKAFSDFNPLMGELLTSR